MIFFLYFFFCLVLTIPVSCAVFIRFSGRPLVLRFFFSNEKDAYPDCSSVCFGKPASTVDYSVFSLDDSVWFVNDNPLATSGTQQRREGKCNINANCLGDLLCFQQAGAAMIEPWSSCCGMGRTSTDHCHEAGLACRPSTNFKLGKTSVPRQQWKGDCDSDVECEGDLRYSQQDAETAHDLVNDNCTVRVLSSAYSDSMCSCDIVPTMPVLSTVILLFPG